MSSKVAFHTLGCKLNFAETSTIGKQFLQKGFSIVDYSEKADVYVINTCTVTEHADKECRQIVRRALRNNPEAYVIVTGCYAQLRPEEISKIDGVDAVLGSGEKFNLFNYIPEFKKKYLSCIYVSPTEELNSFNSSHSTDADDRTRAFFKVQDGCDYKCSFCTIPLARGKSRSMNPEEVIAQFKELLECGYKEIVLTGVNVGDYSSINLDHALALDHDQEKNKGTDLYRLLKMMLEVEGDYRIRISSIEPNLLNDDIIQLAINDQRLVNHFHIPLQSGCDKVLRLMQRRYRTDDYRNLILKLASKIENVGIGVDVIVGFPGETEEDFLDTYNFLRDLPVSYLHVFTYSERPNTKAIEMPGHVDVAERKRRNNMLRILSEKKRNEFYRSMVGTNLKVLVEHENMDGFMKGFSSNYVRVKIPFSADFINKIVEVKITEVDENICTAGTLENVFS
ncbi:MAG TPA: tRNA (N(6)-L-threonylcarbamoyladenosine(37)-C(2))-methylthiotransferase MtaB [Melioribacteraceae bacterium]|nr:tRNA (N(6)-L-threonylcarbamoyladenosine(37)-C(2))-methylthiotransferase MtaB [Melioribacteraceae bacterium]